MKKRINLQLFADGGDGAAAGTTAGATGEGIVDAAQTGRTDAQDDAATQTDGNNQSDVGKKSFEELIKGEYKKDFDARVHKIINQKTASIKSMQEQMDKINPVLRLMSQKYGVDAEDLEGLVRAIEDDNSYYEQEAIEKGMSVEQLKQMRIIERENETLRQMIERDRQQNESERIYNEWMEQAEEIKSVYPNFDFMTEAQNKDFADLLKVGIDVKTAYEVIHKDEIIQGAMAVAVQKTKEQVTNNIRANGNRASENGTSSQAVATFKKDVNSLTKADMEEIEKRIARGEKISFG
ncbi:MAG: hypothetical protein E7267_03875 [Lachnospiraceae bacterium]|nr:hypothetical protein [Lachnospiraceae bacterium]